MEIHKKTIPYGRQSIQADDIEAVSEVLHSDYLTTGPLVSAFEEALCALTGAKYAIACSNATAGLHLACLSLRLPAGSLGLTSAITFVASSNCLEAAGHRADFIDIDPKSRCMSPDALEEYCLRVEVPQVVIPVSFAGVTADLPAILTLSKRFGFRVIEDAAHSIGSTYYSDGKWFQSGSCAHSDLAVFSFHPVKTITTGEGGAVLTNDQALAERLRLLRSHGILRDSGCIPDDAGSWYYQMMELGYNYRITDLQCALGLSQLKRLERIKARRSELVERYRAELSGYGILSVSQMPLQHPCFHLAAVELNRGAEHRKRLFEDLNQCGICTQVHYIPVYWHPYYKNKYGYRAGRCKYSETYYSSCLSLPMYIGLNDDDVAYIINTIIDNL
jgi:UDP-4-amino-4,6-dideoxy-N-acetyl-beta-L-altrosamine transaminase